MVFEPVTTPQQLHFWEKKTIGIPNIVTHCQSCRKQEAKEKCWRTVAETKNQQRWGAKLCKNFDQYKSVRLGTDPDEFGISVSSVARNGFATLIAHHTATAATNNIDSNWHSKDDEKKTFPIELLALWTLTTRWFLKTQYHKVSSSNSSIRLANTFSSR